MEKYILIGEKGNLIRYSDESVCDTMICADAFISSIAINTGLQVPILQVESRIKGVMGDVPSRRIFTRDETILTDFGNVRIAIILAIDLKSGDYELSKNIDCSDRVKGCTIDFRLEPREEDSKIMPAKMTVSDYPHWTDSIPVMIITAIVIAAMMITIHLVTTDQGRKLKTYHAKIGTIYEQYQDSIDEVYNDAVKDLNSGVQYDEMIYDIGVRRDSVISKFISDNKKHRKL